VAVALSSDSEDHATGCHHDPWKTPIFATVTGSESVPVAVNVLVSVVVVAAAVCA
jgi:hypothetical protein